MGRKLARLRVRRAKLGGVAILKTKNIILICVSATIGAILIGIVLKTTLLTQFGFLGGWRSNVYRYQENWLFTHEESHLWREGAFLLWHNGESFEVVYSLTEHPRWTPSEERDWVDNFNRERIGWVSNLPEINPHRPDVNHLRWGRVYEIEGLNPEEWIYVAYEEWHAGIPVVLYHRIFKSTNLEIENPIEFLRNYIDGIPFESGEI